MPATPWIDGVGDTAVQLGAKGQRDRVDLTWWIDDDIGRRAY